MKVKEAAKEAKAYVQDLFGDEIVSGVQLEEVEFDDIKGVWMITVGFWRRMRAKPGDQLGALHRIAGLASQRSFKIVCIRDRDQHVLSVKHRSVPDAE